MGLQLLGTLPVSAVNIGVSAALPVLQAKVSKLQLDLARLGVAISAQASVQVTFPPDLPTLSAAFSAALNAEVLASLLDPTSWVTASADASAELAYQLGLIDAQLTVVAKIVANLSAGLATGGLAGWSYRGAAGSFGARLGGLAGALGASVQAVVVATNAFTSWQAFSAGIHVGASSDQQLANQTELAELHYLGALGGAQWCTGLAELKKVLDLFVLDLQGLRASLAAQLEVSLGLNLPDPLALVQVGAAVDLDWALGNLVSVDAGLALQLEGIQLEIAALLELIVSLQTQLMAGGLTVWSYAGASDELGSALTTELAQGLPGVEQGPGGAIYGLAIATAQPSVWSDFGLIFGVA